MTIRADIYGLGGALQIDIYEDGNLIDSTEVDQIDLSINLNQRED